MVILRLPLILAACAVLPAASAALRGESVKTETRHYDIVAPTKAIAERRGRQLEWSAWVFTNLFAVAPHRGTVTLSDQPGGAGVIRPKFGVGGAVVQTRIGGPEDNWELQWFVKPPDPRHAPGTNNDYDALTHEAAHLQLIYLTNAEATDEMKAKFNGYGGFVADWLDEAVAVYHEPEQMKKQRRQRLRAQMIPMREFFVMSHPLFADDRQAAQVKGQGGVALDHEHTLGDLDEVAKDGQVDAEDIARGRVDREKLRQIDQFYTQALAVMEYMVATGGKPFIRFLVREQARGASMDEVLKRWQVHQREVESLQTRARRTITRPAPEKHDHPRRTKLESAEDFAGVPVRLDEKVGAMPATVEALEADFNQWVRRHYPKYHSGLPGCPK